MNPNRWAERSIELYRRLLRLYPQAYRAAYAAEMLHLFADQCRAACALPGRLGLVRLWLRTLVDAGLTIPAEHLADPQVRLGLLEAAPDAQLPWKGVALMLIPGLIFFASQIAQLTGQDWFFAAFFRAAYILAIPVLLVWLLARRFPIWGLMPLGLLCETLWMEAYRLQYLFLTYESVARNYPLIGSLLKLLAKSSYELTTAVVLAACLGVLLLLIWHNVRNGQIPPAAWRWLGVYGLLFILQVGLEIGRQVIWQGGWAALWQSAEARQTLYRMPFWYLYDALPFLVLIFLGTLFTRRYGALSFLLPLGYLLPAIVFGRYGEWNNAIPFYSVAIIVVVYRFAIALVAPVWLARSTTAVTQRRAIGIPLAAALLGQVGLKAFNLLGQAQQIGDHLGALDFASVIWGQLIIAAGLALAIVLYQRSSTRPYRAH